MSQDTPPAAPLASDRSSDRDSDRAAAEDIVAQVESGSRTPDGLSGRIIIAVCLAWSLFQLWYASPLPFMVGFGVFNGTEARSIHLAFALFLAFTAYPAFKWSPRRSIPIQDWLFAIVGAFCAAYLVLFNDALADRPGAPTAMDVAVGVVGLVLLLEATRRALGPPLLVVALVFLAYTFGGQYMPDVIAHKGASLQKAMSHYWITTEGVFGVALGVSTSMVFLFVLFGAFLERAGAGMYFIRVAFAFMGHLRGGPAKAAVVSSAMTGLISGSSIANVVTTGTFTIPLMKKVGFPGTKAGAVEVASSTNGQLTPPIMGAAAFLMVEYVGISYIEVMKHAIVPALISYIALVYIVHLEACKAGLKGLPRVHVKPWHQAAIGFLGSFLLVAGLAAAVYFGLGWIKPLAGDATPYIAAGLLVVAHVALVWVVSRVPPLPENADIKELPPAGPTVLSGVHFLLPVVVLVWCLMIEQLSPGLSAFWAAAAMIFNIVTQRPLAALFRGQGGAARVVAARQGLADLYNGLLMGARNMIGIGVATAAAGIIVGTVTLTGVGQVLTEMIEYISGGSLVLMLLLTAVVSLLLGMGLPTTANYIVVSTLMAPVIVTLGAENGLIVPLIAAHMFVFYFGILADDTPPVGLAAFAASAISGADPIKTGIQGFAYDIRTAILPFLFIFNTELLLIGVTSWWHAGMVFVFALIAMLTFAAATQRFWLVKCRWYEVIGLLLIAFTIFRPGYWMDRIEPELISVEPARIEAMAEEVPPNGRLRVRVEGMTLEGEEVSKAVMLPMGAPGTGAERLESAGLILRTEDGRVLVDDIVFASAAERLGFDYDWEITEVLMKNQDRPPEELMYIPAFALLILMWLDQRRRLRRQGGEPLPRES
ncbi:TRAP transporter permease [Roseospira marina]|uniref:TRAP transporter permease n=1 Tax=Roseospira marina TaxID=140057 RepID=A0A5M6I8V0_9PROT|nr:TRAP transporter permease [Roseospira marina]KAA5604611.1 TRAP transporter permease [Roseospira marina]MBB4315364.1 TRAP transporter 4TM/12TM fusion protein [Roseospira marina]MBB5088363.1 TRAP transporter 4TM/12TM fusion protein [Roseospira marina]